MALETLDNQIDINDLSLDSAPQGHRLDFNIAREISPEERFRLGAELRELRSNLDTNRDSHFPYLAVNIKLLYPDMDMARQGSLALSESGFENLRKSLNIEFLKNARQDFADLAALLKQLYPIRYPAWDKEFHIGTKFWDTAKADMARGFEEIPLLENILLYAKNLAVLFPERWHKLDLPRDEIWERLIEETGIINHHTADPKSSIWQYLRGLFYAKILFPEWIEELELDPRVWDKLDRDIAKARSENLGLAQFADLLVMKKVFLSRKVNITEQGLEIVMPTEEDYESVPAGLPKERKF